MKKQFFFVLGCLFVSAIAFTQTTAQEDKTKTPADSLAQIKKLMADIEARPDDLAAHEAYVKASGFTKWGAPENADFIKQYEAWMKKFPKSAAMPYALGHAFAGKESPKARPYLLKAVAIDPAYDKAYFDLWIDAERWGDAKAADYLLKAKEAAPKNADYAFYYASSFSDSDLEQYKKLSLQVVKDFPGTERGAQALYWLAARSQDAKEKAAYYEQQKAAFPPDKFNWTESGMSGYYDLLLQQDAGKALSLAQWMADLKKGDARSAKTWEANTVLAQNVMQTEALLNEGKGAEAAAAMEKLTMPRYSSAKEYLLALKSKALHAAGKSDEAYKNLLTAYVKEPSSGLNESLQAYGKALGKDQMAIGNEVWYIRDTSAKQAPNFALENYFTKKISSLSDYKGKVVLLTYWFPGCGPCRGEFPHFENVVKKFKDKDFVYLGINIAPEQDDYVLSFMKGTGYSFIPLKDNNNWKKGPLDNRNAAPVNFLIDGNGKIIFANFRTDGANEAVLEAMISSMLNRKEKGLALH